MDLAEGLSKLAPPAIQMMRAHRSIRARRHRTHRRRHQAQQAPRASEDVLQRAEAAYTASGSLKAVAREVGLGHERLARLLRERGVILRNHSPSTSKIRLMRAMYEQGASLERVGDRFGYTAGTVRKNTGSSLTSQCATRTAVEQARRSSKAIIDAQRDGSAPTAFSVGMRRRHRISD